MAKVQLNTNDWTNLSTTLPMTPDTPYRFMNVGQSDISIAFSATKPEPGDTDFMYGPREPDKAETLIFSSGIPVWAIALENDGAISLQEVT